MASRIDSESKAVGAMLASASSEDRELFLEERQRLLEDRRAESPLLDQLCLLRVVLARLAEGYARALSKFEETLEQKTKMRGGWRKSILHKVSSEYESPMPWLHPFKLAAEELDPLRDELEAAVELGETRERDPARLRDTLAKHGLVLPLPSPLTGPRFPPGNLRIQDESPG
jgi:hypothetical protein